jgi:phosphoglycerol transferase MdoB-like AlkP superfamily enzyme
MKSTTPQNLTLSTLLFIVLLKLLLIGFLDIEPLIKCLVVPHMIWWDLLTFGGIYLVASYVPLLVVRLLCGITVLLGSFVGVYFIETRNFIDWFVIEDMATDMSAIKSNATAFQSYLIGVFVLFCAGLLSIGTSCALLRRYGKKMTGTTRFANFKFLAAVYCLLANFSVRLVPASSMNQFTQLSQNFLLAPCVAYASRAWRRAVKSGNVTKFNIQAVRSAMRHNNLTQQNSDLTPIFDGKPNIVMIFIESLIDDLLNYDSESTYLATQLKSAYQTKTAFESNITPFLNKLKQQSWFHPSAFAHSTYTIKSTMSSLCSVHVLEGMTSEYLKTSYAPCLTKLLKDFGNYSNAFSQPQTMSFDYQQEVFSDFIQFERIISEETLPSEQKEWVNYFGVADETMRQPIMAFVDEQVKQSRPFFLSYLTGVSHHPFATPESFKKKHLSDNQILNDYLNAQNYVDSFISHLIDEFKARNLMENTLFVILGDHGMQLGEHGVIGTPEGPVDVVLKVPLMLYSENPAFQQRFRKVSYSKFPVMNLDIVPTIAGLLGINITGMGHEGVNLIADQKSNDRILYHVTNPIADHSIIVRQGDFKLVYKQRSEEMFMFNLRTDPNERTALEEKRMSAEESQWFQWAQLYMKEERERTASKYGVTK